MRLRSRLLALASLTMLGCTRQVTHVEAPLDVQDVQRVRNVFHSQDYDERQEKECQYLIRMREKAFPAYEAILADPTTTPDEVCGVLGILCDVEGDRRRFLMHAISRLTDADSGVRLNAVILLKRIGTAADTSPLIALLSDEYDLVVYAAAKTLAAIGGSREVVAMDVWLRGVTYRDDAQLRQHVKKCRDALKKRVDEIRAKDPSK